MKQAHQGNNLSFVSETISPMFLKQRDETISPIIMHIQAWIYQKQSCFDLRMSEIAKTKGGPASYFFLITKNLPLYMHDNRRD